MATARDGIEYLLWRHAPPDREVTTLYAVRYPRRSTRARVVYFPRPERLDVDGGDVRLVERARLRQSRPVISCRPVLVADGTFELGTESAINLDGGGSTTLVHCGRLLNRPYSSHDQPAPESRRS